MTKNIIEIKEVSYQLSRVRLAIAPPQNALHIRLWRHQENVSSETESRCLKIVFLVVIYGPIASFMKKYQLLSWESIMHSLNILRS